MKSTGIVRKIDGLGRIVLPIELRKRLEIATGDDIEIYVEGDNIILAKYAPSCLFCGSKEYLTLFEDKNVCRTCRKKLAKGDTK